MDGASDEDVAFTLLNHLSDSAVVTDVQFKPPGPKVIYTNEAFRTFFGRSASDLTGQPLSEVLPELQSSEVLTTLEKRCRQGDSYLSSEIKTKQRGAATSWRISPVQNRSKVTHLVCLLSNGDDPSVFASALRGSEKRYRDLFEHGLVGKAILSPDGRFVKVNQSFCNLLGYEREELEGKHSSIVIQEKEQHDVFGLLGRLVQGELTGYQTERQYVRADGKIVTALVDVVPEKNDDGNIQAVVVQAQDISSLKATEAALRESENQLNAIFDHSPVEILLKDAEGRYVKVNRQFEKHLNVKNEDLRGKLPGEVHYPQLAESMRNHDLEVLKTGKVVVREEETYRENLGEDKPHFKHTVKFPILDKDEVIGLGAIATDITEMKNTEQALRESESRLWDFAEIAADWFWETDENLVITYVSDVHRQITGIPDDQIIGRTREELFKEKVYKATNPAIHLRTLRNYWDSMVEYSVTREDGREIIVHDRASPFFDQQGNFRGYRGVGRDITEQRLLTGRIAYQASRDPLTGAVNRREFERNLDEIVKDAHNRGSEHVLCFIDLDKFKLLNDTLGHAAGDHLLKIVVEKIGETISPNDVVARIGGDEFGILLKDTDIKNAKKLVLNLVRSLKSHDFKWRERTFSIAMSAGLAPINEQTKSSSEVLASADSACYRAKQSSGEETEGVWVSDENEAARLRTYTVILRSLASTSVDLAGVFKLVGQPICVLKEPEQSPPWYEVLLRLVGDDGRFYRPIEFIRLAEQYGKMPMVDQWVLETAVRSHATIVRQIPDAVMSINLSGTSFADTRLQKSVYELVKMYRLQPENICFEIAEQTAMTDLKGTVSLVETLSRHGYRIALDEFGSGPSSFACLKHLRVNYLKLYGNLVREMRQSGPDIAIVESINELSHRLDLSIIAVQVETQEAVQTLKKIGVEYGQGDALATSRPLDEVIVELQRNHRN